MAESIGYQTRALTRALDILGAFSDERPALSVAELHSELEIPKPTIVRLSAVLERYGYLSRADGVYWLGPKVVELGTQFLRRTHLVDLVEPVLESVRDELDETVCLGMLQGAEVVHIAVIPSKQPVHYVTEVGSRDMAHATGLGKALLALLPDDAVVDLLGPEPFARFTSSTLVERDELVRELARTRERGYALDREETAEGLRCVAVGGELPLLGAVAVSASGLSSRFTDSMIPTFAQRLRDAMPVLRSTLASIAMRGAEARSAR